MDQNEINEILDRYIDAVKKHCVPRMVVLYGSYAKGTAREDSDIDIAVIVDQISGDYLDQIFLLYKIRRDIDDRIEPVLLESTDDPSGFLDEIKRTGRILYQAA
jgi:predicted nucleotidyltransferase